jgi:hypothetical protein
VISFRCRHRWSTFWSQQWWFRSHVAVADHHAEPGRQQPLVGGQPPAAIAGYWKHAVATVADREIAARLLSSATLR